MRLDPKPSLFILILGILTALTSPLAAQTSPAAQVKAEIARLQQSIKDNPVASEELKGLASMITDSLKSATDAVDAGQMYLALEKLGQAEDLLEGARSAADKSEVEKNGLPAFESRWGKVSLQLTAL